MRRAVKTLVVLAVLISTQFVTANAEAMTFKQSFGGTNRDWGFGIFVDSHYIYVVGETESFGPDPPNLFLSIFSRADNSHKCASRSTYGSVTVAGESSLMVGSSIS
jgi:hypothetical protein